MTDFLLLYLGTITGTLILVLVVVVSLIELRRRSRILSERAERYPAACELETLTHDVARLEEHRERLQEEAEDAKSVIRRRESAEQWLEANHTLYEKASRELPGLQAEVETARQQRDSRITERDEARVECEGLRNEIRELQQQLAPSRLIIERKKEAQEWLDANYATYERARRELPVVLDDMAAAEMKLESLTAACTDAEIKNKQLLSEQQSLEREIEPAKFIIQQRRDAEEWLKANSPSYERISHDLPRKVEELAATTLKLNELRQARDSQEAAIHQLQSERTELEREIEPAKFVIQQRREAEGWLAANKPLYDRITQELPQLEADRDGVEAELKELRADFVEVESLQQRAAAERDWKLAENQRLHEVIKGQIAEGQRLTRELGELQAKQSGVLAELEQLRVKKDAAESELQFVESEVAQAKLAVVKLHEQCQDLESDRAVKLEVVQALDRLKKTLEADVERLDDEIENKKARLEAELKQINDLIAAAVHRWEQIAPTVGISDENKLAELWSPALSPAQFSVESDNDEQASLERTARHLSDLGLRFDQRVLNAFHTSLKVAEMSPLVVLAGISGTGKSELPRRYAEGMGMHSLTLAVQPRWDSPQDMFGFYNYLENRYRATELARALVQMDSFFNEAGRNWCYPDGWERNNLSDRMLLVLLDEMNLARVEYYFSEFLSRLETRRGIDRRSPLERRKAEIALEVGMQSLSRNNGQVNVQQQPTLQLFVDTNVLFVGTMNEDESTQTLSDKVVDRANVLRFGRPTKLASRTPEHLAKPSDSWLPYDTWRRWIRSEDTLPTNVHEEVSQWGQKLNQAMQSIGRPFAHRTFASMLAYVANYPDPDAFKLAMADQVELKLLPKFRGLDPQDAGVRRSLDEVKKVLSDLGDDKLQKAVEEAAKGGDHQFVWHGVDRLENT